MIRKGKCIVFSCKFLNILNIVNTTDNSPSHIFMQILACYYKCGNNYNNLFSRIYLMFNVSFKAKDGIFGKWLFGVNKGKFNYIDISESKRNGMC